MSIEIEVDDQEISPLTHFLNFGLAKSGTLVKSPLAIISKSSLETTWNMEEFYYSSVKKSFEHLEQCNLSYDTGFFCHAGSSCDLQYYLKTAVSIFLCDFPLSH